MAHTSGQSGMAHTSAFVGMAHTSAPQLPHTSAFVVLLPRGPRLLAMFCLLAMFYFANPCHPNPLVPDAPIVAPVTNPTHLRAVPRLPVHYRLLTLCPAAY